jgi:ACS family hexuronate transporter-like MFS transporter
VHCPAEYSGLQGRPCQAVSIQRILKGPNLTAGFRKTSEGVEPRRAKHSIRWWIGALLFTSTVINYLDRQTLSILAPFLKTEYHWTNTDYAAIVIAFRVAYSLGQTVCGRFIDRVGTRTGITLTVAAYSLVSIFTPLARGLRSFALFRFLLGAGESANWPAATKAVSEWFPKSERGLATALFDSGSSIGGAIAPFLILGIYTRWGWRPAFIVPGLLGFAWLILWRSVYHPPETHPFISAGERSMLLADRPPIRSVRTERLRWRQLLRIPQTWGVIVARTFTDPVWFFITDWFPIYLIAKGFDLRGSLIAVWVPFIAADLGNFAGGAATGHLVRRGWAVGKARKAVVVAGGVGMTLLIPTIFSSNLYVITLLFALATFFYASFSTIAHVLSADLFPNHLVASVSGLGGTGSGLGTIAAFLLVGRLADAHQAAATHSFDTILIAGGVIPFIGMLLVLLLVRNNRSTREGLVQEI